MKYIYEELSEQEYKCFCGGDKAMKSLGDSIGSIGGNICNFLEYFGQIAQNSPTTYNPITKSLKKLVYLCRIETNKRDMEQTDLQKENKKLKRINFILIIYVVVSIGIQLYNILV